MNMPAVQEDLIYMPQKPMPHISNGSDNGRTDIFRAHPFFGLTFTECEEVANHHGRVQQRTYRRPGEDIFCIEKICVHTHYYSDRDRDRDGRVVEQEFINARTGKREGPYYEWPRAGDEKWSFYKAGQRNGLKRDEWRGGWEHEYWVDDKKHGVQVNYFKDGKTYFWKGKKVSQPEWWLKQNTKDIHGSDWLKLDTWKKLGHALTAKNENPPTVFVKAPTVRLA